MRRRFTATAAPNRETGSAAWLAVKNGLFTLLVPGTVAVYVPCLLSRPLTLAAGWRGVLAAVLFVAGGAVYAWCLWDFAHFGRATPAPLDPPTRLVVRGLYRYSRNPMYLGVLAVILGWLALTPCVALVVYWIAVAVAFELFVVFYEEPTLRRQFGAGYDDYRARVDRWLSRPGFPAPAGRPLGVTLLVWFLVFGMAVSGLSVISLLTPNGWLEPMWRLNPRAHVAFAQMGGAAPALLVLVCAGCAACAYGCFEGRRWAYRLTVVGLTVQLAGALVNALLGVEPRAWFGVPIVALVLFYLSRPRVRGYFEPRRRRAISRFQL